MNNNNSHNNNNNNNKKHSDGGNDDDDDDNDDDEPQTQIQLDTTDHFPTSVFLSDGDKCCRLCAAFVTPRVCLVRGDLGSQQHRQHVSADLAVFWLSDTRHGPGTGESKEAAITHHHGHTKKKTKEEKKEKVEEKETD